MDLGSICLCLVVGALIVFASIGIGVCYGRCNQGQLNDDSDVRTNVPVRDRDRGRDNRSDISDEELAAMLRAICVTGICPSRNEKEYLQEAAERLEKRIEDD